MLTIHRPHLVLCALLCAGAFAAVAGRAEAGFYTVHTCRTPAGAPASGWDVTTLNPRLNTSRSSCPGGPFELEMRGNTLHPDNDELLATFRPPSGTEITGFTIWRRLKQSYPYNYRLLQITRSGYHGREECLTTQSSCRWLGVNDPFGFGNMVKSSGLSGITGLQLRLTCGHTDGSGTECAKVTIASHLYVHRADITIFDPSSPRFTSPPDLRPGSRLAGVVPVNISATDERGGGVYLAEFEVDGRIVQSSVINPNNGLCQEPFTVRVPCPQPDASGTVGFDTTRVPDGAHRVRVLVTDAARNAVAWGPVTVTTANAHCNPFPRVKSLRLRSGLGPRAKRHRVTTRYGRRLRVHGRLATAAGVPVAGAHLCVAGRDDSARAAIRPEGELVTNAKGRFSFTVGRGPSRRVFFVYRVPGGAVTSSLLVRVRAPVRLGASARFLRNGQTVRFGGRLRAGPFPRRGVIVEMQAHRADGWQTFKTTRTNRKGRFRARYTFTRTVGVQRYKIRARVPEQAGYPYTAGGSRPVELIVSG